MAVKILMVCLGNICRSPLAEGILQIKLDSKVFFVDSAGTAGYHLGKKPDYRSIEVARKHGIDIAHQRCRQFGVHDFNDFDYIFTMDKSNYRNVISLAQNENEVNKVKLLLNEIELDIKEVPDPYYDTQNGFEYVFQLIDKACEVIAANLNASSE